MISPVLRRAVVAIVLGLGSSLLAKGAASTERVYRDHGRLMLALGGRTKVLAEDANHLTFASGRRTFFAYQDLSAAEYSLVVIETLRSGALVRRVRVNVEPVLSVNAIMDGMVLDDARVFLDCHVNPSLYVGIAVNMKSGKCRYYEGHLFTWNKSRTRVAYFQEPPHFSLAKGDCCKVCIGTGTICMVPRWSGLELRWVSDKELLIRLEDQTRITARLKTNGAWAVTRRQEPALKKGSSNRGTAVQRHGELEPPPEIHDRTVGKWANQHEGDVGLAGIQVQQFPDNAYEARRWEGKHPVMILYVFKDGRVHQNVFEPDGRISTDFWWKEKLGPDTTLWRTIDRSYARPDR